MTADPAAILATVNAAVGRSSCGDSIGSRTCANGEWLSARGVVALKAAGAVGLALSQPAKLLVAGNLERKVRGWEKSSDHAPTWITLAGKRTAAE